MHTYPRKFPKGRWSHPCSDRRRQCAAGARSSHGCCTLGFHGGGQRPQPLTLVAPLHHNQQHHTYSIWEIISGTHHLYCISPKNPNSNWSRTPRHSATYSHGNPYAAYCLGRFWVLSVEIHVFLSATRYMLISFGLPLLIWDIFNRRTTLVLN